MNPNVLIDEIWKDTKLDQLAESAESKCSIITSRALFNHTFL